MKFPLPAYLLVLALPLAYARWIEPNWIELTRHSLPAPTSRPLKIAHLSDLHIRAMGNRESKILSILAEEKPDAVLITGDSVAENANYQAVGAFLKEIRAPLGTWLVKGNWEHWRPSPEEQAAYSGAGVRLLNNSSEKLLEGIWLIGLDDEYAGQPDLQEALKSVPAKSFKIGLIHSPSFFDHSAKAFDIVLAGHTHGGQIRLPFLKPFWLPHGSSHYVEGWYEKNGAKMYVSRGLGNSILDLRFFCRPELTIFSLGG